MGFINETNEDYYQGLPDGLGGFDTSYGKYQFISLQQIIDNFLVAYVGDGKILDHVKRTDILFHAKRGLQEFSYDTLKSHKSQEVEVGPSLSIPLPQDYVNYVKVTYVDGNGIEHIVYPTRLTSNPTQSILQGDNYEYLFDEEGELLTGSSFAEEGWSNGVSGMDNNTDGIRSSNDPDEIFSYHIGTRYGSNPELSQSNGWFTIDEKKGVIAFSSDMVNRIVIIKYITDGLGYDADTKIHKYAEEALYMHILHSILSTKVGVQEYVIARFDKRRKSALRNAKIRLSNIKTEEIAQVMRGKSKQIKH